MQRDAGRRITPSSPVRRCSRQAAISRCAGRAFLAFSTTWISGDVDDFAAGVQTNVDVESSLLAGDRVTLEVLDESGASLATMSRTVDAGGGARFEFVTLPAPRAVLRASGHGVCGTTRAGHDR
jgi:hypothetical protein